MTKPKLLCVVWWILLALVMTGLECAAWTQSPADAGWAHYGGDAGGARYSTASQITRDNVAQLKVAWTFRTGALPHDEELDHKATFEATPILIDGKLFLSTPYDHVIALTAVSGAKLWEFDPKLEHPYGFSEVTSRGVSAWRDPAAKPGQPCALRIFIGTLDARLIALDGENGKPCADFGSDDGVDLTTGVKLRDPGDYQVTSAPAIYRDLVITGSSIGDNRAVTLERGIVRAFDARTGKLRWSWDPIPWALATTPRTGAGNAWSTLSVDSEHGLVFIPTGSASPDYYGGIPQGRQQVGKFGGGAEGRDRRIRVGLPGGASRYLGLRRGFAADTVHVEGQDARSGHHYKNGAGLRAESPNRGAPDPRRRAASCEG